MNQQVKILDIIGISNLLDFSSHTKDLYYGLGSLLIYHNLKTDTKTFIKYHQDNILLLKIINKSNELITIDNSFLVVVWDIPSFRISFCNQLSVNTSNYYPNKQHSVFLEEIKTGIYLILISIQSNINILYQLNIENYELSLICNNIVGLNSDIIGFKSFINSNEIIIMLSNEILYYHIYPQSHQLQVINNIHFSFNLIKYSIKISNLLNVLCFITSKGNCLIYDQNGNGRPPINPIDQEVFTICEFSGDSIICGTNNCKIYCFSIYENSLRFFIDPTFIILSLKNNYLFDFKNEAINYCNDNNSIDYNSNNNSVLIGPKIDNIFLDQHNDSILIKCCDNSIIFSALNTLINKKFNNKGQMPKSEILNNIFDNIYYYSFSHFSDITSIECPLNDKDNKNDNKDNNTNLINSSLFFTSSIDQSVQFYNFNNYNKIVTTYFDLEKIKNKDSNNYSNINMNKSYLSTVTFHPIYTHKLFAGDNKGSLYLFDTKEKIFQYKKYIIGTYQIQTLEFNNSGHLLCIGFDTGMNIICDINNECDFLLKLSEHFINPNEIEKRKINNHKMSFSYFFKNNLNDDIILYTKTLNEIEIVSLQFDKRGYNNPNYPNVHKTLRKTQIQNIKMFNNILDIIVHCSENYTICLLDDLLICINSIKTGEITGVLDLKYQINYAYNISMDYSGLFLALICDVKDKNTNNKSDLLFFEIGTGKLKNSVFNIFPLNHCCFDRGGEYLGICGDNGIFSIWKLPEEMAEPIANVAYMVKNNNEFWSMYEIKYDNNDDVNNYNANKQSIIINKNMYNSNSCLNSQEINNNNYNNYYYNDLNYNNNKNFDDFNFNSNKYNNQGNCFNNNRISNDINDSCKFYNQNNNINNNMSQNLNNNNPSNDYNKLYYNHPNNNELNKNNVEPNNSNNLMNKLQNNNNSSNNNKVEQNNNNMIESNTNNKKNVEPNTNNNDNNEINSQNKNIDADNNNNINNLIDKEKEIFNKGENIFEQNLKNSNDIPPSSNLNKNIDENKNIDTKNDNFKDENNNEISKIENKFKEELVNDNKNDYLLSNINAEITKENNEKIINKNNIEIKSSNNINNKYNVYNNKPNKTFIEQFHSQNTSNNSLKLPEHYKSIFTKPPNYKNFDFLSISNDDLTENNKSINHINDNNNHSNNNKISNLNNQINNNNNQIINENLLNNSINSTHKSNHNNENNFQMQNKDQLNYSNHNNNNNIQNDIVFQKDLNNNSHFNQENNYNNIYNNSHFNQEYNNNNIYNNALLQNNKNSSNKFNNNFNNNNYNDNYFLKIPTLPNINETKIKNKNFGRKVKTEATVPDNNIFERLNIDKINLNNNNDNSTIEKNKKKERLEKITEAIDLLLAKDASNDNIKMNELNQNNNNNNITSNLDFSDETKSHIRFCSSNKQLSTITSNNNGYNNNLNISTGYYINNNKNKNNNVKGHFPEPTDIDDILSKNKSSKNLDNNNNNTISNFNYDSNINNTNSNNNIFENNNYSNRSNKNYTNDNIEYLNEDINTFEEKIKFYQNNN